MTSLQKSQKMEKQAYRIKYGTFYEEEEEESMLVKEKASYANNLEQIRAIARAASTSLNKLERKPSTHYAALLTYSK